MDMMLVGIAMALAAVGLLAFSFLKVDAPVVEEVKKERKQKQTKQDKIAAKAAAASKKSESFDAEEAVAEEKAERKRQKERERKAAKKVREKKAEQEAAAAAVAASKVVTDAPVEGEGGKKKKKKKKTKAQAAKAEAAKAAAAAAVAVEEEEEEEQEPNDDGWVKILNTRKEKVVEEVEDSAPVFSDMLVIESDKLALVIGTGGSTLELIQSTTNAHIDVPKKGGVRSHTLITGPTKKAVADAKECLQQLITKGYSSITHEGQMDQGIVVPTKFLGQIIGPGGATIKLLSKTGCKVNTPKRDDDSNLVTVVGEADKVKEVIAAIQQIMDQGFSSMTHEGWVAKVIQVPRGQIGGVIGPSGANIKKLQTETNTRVNIPDSKTDPCDMSICGLAADVEVAYAQVAASLLPPEPEDIPVEWSKEAILAIDLSF